MIKNEVVDKIEHPAKLTGRTIIYLFSMKGIVI